jgi:hypothetical protein
MKLAKSEMERIPSVGNSLLGSFVSVSATKKKITNGVKEEDGRVG